MFTGRASRSNHMERNPLTYASRRQFQVAVVAYAIRGCNDLVVDGETGFLVPFGDVHGLADKLAWLAQHPDERHRMGMTGRNRIEETFSLEAVLPQMRAIYENELGRKGM
jgi:glycosyltransferase involved in cell wall biosynthesis